MAGGVRFGVLGPLTLQRDGETVPLPSGRQRSLLALLLAADGAPLSRDRLIDELWGEHPPPTAVKALHVHLSKLRGLLGGLLALRTSGYAIATDAIELDVRSFEALVARARTEPEHAIALLDEALALFRGEPLGDVAAEGAVAQWRRALEEQRLQAIVLRLDARLAAGESAPLTAELERLTSEYPYQERLWAQLMLALYRSGRQADALDVYQRVRRLLATELGLEPGEELAALQRRVLEQDPALADEMVAVAAAPAGAAAPRALSSLPSPPTRLIGREPELASAAATLAAADVRLLSFTGPGGVGKTRLMLELARRSEARFADGAVLVRLEQLTDPALVVAEIASALARRDAADGPSADGLVGYLRERELLLVIDNFEHLLPAAVALAELLADAAGIKCLVSSRMALRIRGEQVFEVEPLALPLGDSEQEIEASPAVQLFLQCALATNRKLQVDAEVRRTIATITRALDGLPLAIELAGARALALSPAQIAQQLVAPLSIGARSLRDLPERQQTLQATIRWSYDLLEPQAQAALQTAGAFLGGFTLPALEAVSGAAAIEQQLDELLEARLVRLQSDGERFALLELVRAFALEELRAGGREAAVRGAHRAYLAAHIAAVSEAFDAGESPGPLAARLQADHANVLAALEDAIESGDAPAAVALALGMRPLWIANMLRQECTELVARLLGRCSVPGPSELSLLRVASFVDSSGGRTGWTRRLAARAQHFGDSEALAIATGNLFSQAINARNREEIARLRPQLLALISPQTSVYGLAWARCMLSVDAYLDGRFEAACEHAALAAEHAQEIGHDLLSANAVGTLLLARSAREGVITHAALSEALEWLRRPNVQPQTMFALWLAARYAVGVDPDAATRWLAHAERILTPLAADVWPESDLRDETMAILAITDLTAALATTPPVEGAVALGEAIAWLAERDPDEVAPRERALIAALTPS